jgi:phage terminase large subunit-like protein
VLDGGIVAGRLVRLACRRHLTDLERGPDRGLSFDLDEVARVFEFFSFLRLPADGQLDGKPFDLEPFQQFIIGNLFGWMGEDGYRRFRTGYVEIGKGNGKSPLAGGIGLLGLVADGEAAAEIYSGATTSFQAGILFRDARMMAEASPALRSRLDIGLHNIAYEATASFFRPVSSEHRQLSGPRPHMALIDEIHEHPSALVVDKLRAGTKGRRQALIFEITNSGHDRTTVCWHHHDYSARVLEGHLENDAWFAYVCQLDPCERHFAEGQSQPQGGCPDCDDWRDESKWPKANPGLDTILPRKYLREQVDEARGMPAKEGIVRRLNFCEWTEGVTRAVPMDKWDLCRRDADEEALLRREVFLGLDIGSTGDFTALALLFPHDDEETIEVEDGEKGRETKRVLLRRSYTLRARFWLPESPANRRDEATEQKVLLWRRLGLVKTTPGDSVDYDVVVDDIVQLADRYAVREVAIDRGFQAHHTAQLLLKHFGEKRVAVCPNNALWMNAPFREFLELVRARRIHHDGNPVVRWMLANAVARARNGLIMPDKEASADKIDWLSAAVTGLGRAIVQPPTPKNPYETRGIEAV